MIRIGIEVELTGIDRYELATAISHLYGVGITETDGYSPLLDLKYKRYHIGEWVVDFDGSIGANNMEQNVELVSPVLTADTLPQLFDILIVVKALGGYVNKRCGIHIHIDKVSNVDTLIQKFKLEQGRIYRDWGVNQWREERYCKKFTEDVNLTDISNKDLKYFGMNLHSIYVRNTIEFRIFNATLERCEIIKMLDWVFHFVYSSNEYADYYDIFAQYLRS